MYNLHLTTLKTRQSNPGLTLSTCGSAYDDNTEELTWFANQVVRSQEDFTRCNTHTYTQTWLDSCSPSVTVLIV